MTESHNSETNESMEALQTVIELNFLRHGEKGPNAEDDRFTQLSKEGVEEIVEQSVSPENKSLANAYGSNRERAVHSAMIKMTGEDSTMEEINNMEKGMLGASPRVTNNLNFVADTATATGNALNSAYGRGELLSWMVNDSDTLGQENDDLDRNITYSGQAANIAEIVSQYLETGSDRWSEIHKKDQERSVDGSENGGAPQRGYTNKLERFMGSHQTVTESFLLKVIDKIKGREERDKLVEALNYSGFKVTEGFKVTITNTDGEKTIHVTYDKFDEKGNPVFRFDEDIPTETLDEIITEGEEFRVATKHEAFDKTAVEGEDKK